MVQATAGSSHPELASGDEPLFNVDVKMRANTTLEDVERQARAAGIQPERAQALLNALRNAPQIRIGSSVSRARADAAQAQFGKAGLLVEITPVLLLQDKFALASDANVTCPACEQRVQLGAQRQCPECGVFVDKVSPEDVLRRKLLRQERAKIDSQLAREARDSEQKTRNALEAALRKKIRDELEKEYGLKERRSRLTSAPVLAVAALAVAAGAFVGGRGSLGTWPWQQAGGTGTVAAAGDPDKLLASMGGKAAAGAPAEGTPVADADLDDPLIRQAAGKGTGGKGLTIEQAVAAAQVLGKSVGAGTGAGAGAAGAAGSGDAAAAAASEVPPVPVPAAVKTMLALELARQMAEMGEWSRAQAVVAALGSSSRTVADPAFAAAAQATDVEVRAWALQGVAPGQSRAAVDTLLTRARAAASPAGQAQSLGLAGAILSGQPALSEEVPRAFLQEGVQAAKRIEPQAERTAVASELTVAVGQTLLSEATRAIRAGAWSRAQTAGTRLERMADEAADPAVQARLLAMDSQLKAQSGKAEPAARSLARGLQSAERVADLPQRAVLLQQLARLTDASAQAQIGASAGALQTMALTRAGAERARTLAELAVLYAQAGLKGKADQAAAAATATPGVAPADAVALQARLIVWRELAAARLLYASGAYAEAEAALRRVGDYVL